MNWDGQSVLLVLSPLIIQLAGLTVAVINDAYIRRIHRTLLLIVAVLVSTMILQNYAEFLCVTKFSDPRFRTWLAIYGYSIRPVILVIFIYIINPNRHHSFSWILTTINFLVHLTSLWSGICFRISESNHYVGGPLSGFSLWVSLALLAQILYYIRKTFLNTGKLLLWIPVLIMLLILGSFFLDQIANDKTLPLDFLTIATVSSCIFFYIWLHLLYVKEHEKDLKAEQRMRIMISQIQPHFLFNTLSTIQALCRIDPDKADYTIGKLATFLRQNMRSLELTGIVPFTTELEHTKVYTDIEQIRFEDIRIRYDIQTAEFKIPPLSLQPIVENAIRHGIRSRKDGIVTVTSRKTDGFYEVIVWDNGIGFDVKKAEQCDDSHVGIRNVRERIQKMCGGTMKITSNPGEGTIVTIRIPEKSKEQTGKKRRRWHKHLESTK